MLRGLVFLQAFVSARWLRPKTRAALEAHQAELLGKQRDFFCEHSPLFRAHGWSDDFTMDKSVMMGQFDELNTVGVTKDDCFSVASQAEATRDFAPTVRGISVGLSSGTSGSRGLFLSTPREQAIWAGQMLGKMLPPGKLFGYRVAFFIRLTKRGNPGL